MLNQTWQLINRKMRAKLPWLVHTVMPDIPEGNEGADSEPRALHLHLTQQPSTERLLTVPTASSTAVPVRLRHLHDPVFDKPTILLSDMYITGTPTFTDRVKRVNLSQCELDVASLNLPFRSLVSQCWVAVSGKFTARPDCQISNSTIQGGTKLVLGDRVLLDNCRVHDWERIGVLSDVAISNCNLQRGNEILHVFGENVLLTGSFLPLVQVLNTHCQISNCKSQRAVLVAKYPDTAPEPLECWIHNSHDYVEYIYKGPDVVPEH